MNISSILALVNYNGDIINDELMSSKYVSEVSKYLEVDNSILLDQLVCGQS